MPFRFISLLIIFASVSLILLGSFLFFKVDRYRQELRHLLASNKEETNKSDPYIPQEIATKPDSPSKLKRAKRNDISVDFNSDPEFKDGKMFIPTTDGESLSEENFFFNTIVLDEKKSVLNFLTVDDQYKSYMNSEVQQEKKWLSDDEILSLLFKNFQLKSKEKNVEIDLRNDPILREEERCLISTEKARINLYMFEGEPFFQDKKEKGRRFVLEDGRSILYLYKNDSNTYGTWKPHKILLKITENRVLKKLPYENSDNNFVIPQNSKVEFVKFGSHMDFIPKSNTIQDGESYKIWMQIKYENENQSDEKKNQKMGWIIGAEFEEVYLKHNESKYEFTQVRTIRSKPWTLINPSIFRPE